MIVFAWIAPDDLPVPLPKNMPGFVNYSSTYYVYRVWVMTWFVADVSQKCFEILGVLEKVPHAGYHHRGIVRQDLEQNLVEQI